MAGWWHSPGAHSMRRKCGGAAIPCMKPSATDRCCGPGRSAGHLRGTGCGLPAGGPARLAPGRSSHRPSQGTCTRLAVEQTHNSSVRHNSLPTVLACYQLLKLTAAQRACFALKLCEAAASRQWHLLNPYLYPASTRPSSFINLAVEHTNSSDRLPPNAFQLRPAGWMEGGRALACFV